VTVNAEVDAYTEAIYNSLGETYSEAELKEAVRVAHEGLTPEQRERMDPGFKRRYAVNQSVEYPDED
jgi:hypothetical protein